MRAFAFRLPVRDGVWLGARPRLRPLIRSEGLGRPAGLRLVSRREIRIVDWRFGEASELSEVTIPAPDEADIWSPRPPGHRGAHTNNAGSQADLRARRLESWVLEHLGEPVERLVALASQRGWADLVLAGDVALLEQIAGALPANAPGCILDPRMLEWRGAARAADELSPVLQRTREERQRELVAEAMDHAAAGGRGAVGDRNVLAALALGRVDHLLVDACDGPDADSLDELVGLAVETDAAVSALEPLTADGGGARPWPSCGGRRARRRHDPRAAPRDRRVPRARARRADGPARAVALARPRGLSRRPRGAHDARRARPTRRTRSSRPSSGCPAAGSTTPSTTCGRRWRARRSARRRAASTTATAGRLAAARRTTRRRRLSAPD